MPPRKTPAGRVSAAWLAIGSALPIALLGAACAGVRPPGAAGALQPAPPPAHGARPAVSVPPPERVAAPQFVVAPDPATQTDPGGQRLHAETNQRRTDKLNECRDAVTASRLDAADVVPLFNGAACVVSGAQLSQSYVDVPLSSGGSLDLTLTNVPADIVPPASGQQRAAIRVRGPLAFAGSAVLSGLTPSHVIELIPGLVRGGVGTWLYDVHSAGSSVTASAQIGFVDVGEVHAPCNALRTDDTMHAQQVPLPKSNRWTARAWSDSDDQDESDDEFTLSAGPGAAPITLRGGAEFERLAEQSGWMKLSARYNDGSDITGWARSSTVRRLKPDEEPAEMGSGGLGLSGTPDCADPQMPQNSRRVKVRLPGGTAVVAAPNGTQWASTTQPLEVRALVADAFAWVQLLEVPGITEGSSEHGELRHFYVARSQIALLEKPEPAAPVIPSNK